MRDLKRFTAFLMCFCMLGNVITPAYGAVPSTGTFGKKLATASNADTGGGGSATPSDAEKATSSDAEKASMSNALKLPDGECEIRIVNNNNNDDFIPIHVGDTYQLQIEVTKGFEDYVTYFIDYSSGGTVDESGLVTSLEPGYFEVTAGIKNETSNGWKVQSTVLFYGVENSTQIYSVNLNANGSAFEHGDTVMELRTLPRQSMKLPSLTYDGNKHMTGWYSDQDCNSDSLVIDPNRDYFFPKKDMTLYAGWAEFYTVTYDYNGVSYDDELSHVEEISKETAIGSKCPDFYGGPNHTDGRLFRCWRTESGIELDKNEVREYVPAADETLTALWTDIFFTITFIEDPDGIYPDTVIYLHPGEEIGRAPHVNDTEEQLFAGWINEEGQFFSENDMRYYIPTQSETFTAQWVDFYTITFMDGEKLVTTAEVIPGNEVETSPYIYESTEKIFIGWNNEDGEFIEKDDIYSYIPKKSEMLTTKWVTNFYTITFMDGETLVTTAKVIPGNGVEESPYIKGSAEKMFIGWNNEDGQSIKKVYSYIPKKSETLTAQWETDFHTITFMDGEKLVTTAKVIPGNKVDTSPYMEESTEKIFIGWNNEDGNFIKKGAIYMPNKSETLTAQWETDFYTITYMDGTEILKVSLVLKGEQLISAGMPYPQNTSDRALNGWLNSEETFISKNNLSNYVPTKSETITAQWTTDFYTLKYFNRYKLENTAYILYGHNASSGGLPSISDSGNNILVGWKNSDGLFIPKNELSDYVPTKSESLTALFDASYTVSYDPNGGAFTSSSYRKEKVAVGTAINRAFDNNVEKEGYKFSGWYEKETGLRVTNYVYIPTGNITLVAGWQEYYTVTFDGNGGDIKYDSYKVDTALKGESVNLLSETSCNKEGYILKGWSETPDGNVLLKGYDYIPVDDITLYAQWAEYHTITYDAGIGYFGYRGGEKITTEQKQIAAGGSVDYLPSPACDTAYFEGWFTADGKRVSNGYTPKSDETLYAKWIEQGHTVVLHGNGPYISLEGDYVSEAQLVVPDGYSIGYISTKNRKGYQCNWYLDATFTTPYNMSAPVDEDLELYAKWVKTVTVTWDGNGGYNDSGRKNGSYTRTQGDILEAQTLPKVFRDGYAFNYWMTDEGEVLDQKSHVYESMTLYAQWTQGYKVTLDLKGGQLEDRYKHQFYVKKGSKCNTVSTGPRKDGAAFLGWIDEDGNRIASVYSFIPQKDTVLTALYDTNTVKVRFHAGESSIYDAYNKEYVKTLETWAVKNGNLNNNIVREPYDYDNLAFSGWSLNENGSDTIDLSTHVFTTDTNLYPIWDQALTICFNYMGGGSSSSNTVTEGQEITYPREDSMYKEGYTFDGWYTNTSYTGERINIPFTPDKSMQLYAKWIPGNVKTYQVTYDSTGGSQVDVQTIIKGQPAWKPEAPKKAGSIFLRWYTDANCIYAYDFDAVVYKDITLYAKWMETTNIADATITVTKNYYYTGQMITPKLFISMGGLQLNENVDYEVTGGGINAGTATVVVTGKGDYTGKTEVVFTIHKAPMAEPIPEGPFTVVYGQTLGSIDLPTGWSWERGDDGDFSEVGERRETIVFAASDENHEDQISQVKVTVTPGSLKDAQVVLDRDSDKYTGKDIKPYVTSVTLNNREISSDQYTVSYSDNRNVGTATVTVTGSGNYIDSAKATFSIIKGDPELEIGNQVYKTIYGRKLSSITLPKGWSWQNPDIEVGNVTSGTVSRNFLADFTTYDGSNYDTKQNVKLKVQVLPREILQEQVSLNEYDVIYNGQEQKPQVIVNVSGKALVEEQDYTLVYTNNINVGTALVSVTGKGNYKGFVKTSFKIIEDPYDIASADVTVTPLENPYTGEKVEPSVSVQLMGKTLTNGTHFNLTYSNNVEPGITSALIEGIEPYHGKQSEYFIITPTNYKLSAAYGDKLSDVRLPANWSWKTPDSYVGDVTDTEGRNFHADFAVEDQSRSDEFTIVVAPKNINETALTIDGDSLVYDPDKNAEPEVFLHDKKLDKKLVEGKDYTIQYEDNENAGEARVVITGANNYKGVITDSFTIDKAKPEPELPNHKPNEPIRLSIKERPFFLYMTHAGDGEVTFTSSDDAVFTVDYMKNDYDEMDGRVSVAGIGMAKLTIEITESTNYAAAKQEYTVIVEEADISSAQITLLQENYSYSGLQICPEIKVSLDGGNLKKGTDYTITYGQNINAGTNAGSISITGIGDYKGGTTTNFDIAKIANPTALPGQQNAVYGIQLRDIQLSDEWTWKNPQAYVGNVGINEFAVILPEATNYLEKTGTVKLVVTARKLADSMVTLEYQQTEYDGKAKAPAITVKDGGRITAADYQVVYSANLEPGTAKVTITARNNYTGTVEKTFTIIPAILKQEDVLVKDTFTYDGTRKMPVPKVKHGGISLKQNTDYTVTYGENIKAGKASVTVTGKGRYQESIAVTFIIEKAESVVKEPTGLKAVYGSKLSAVALPKNFKWGYGEQSVGDVGKRTFNAAYISPDSNYKDKSMVLTIAVEARPLTQADFKLEEKTWVYDGTAAMPKVYVLATAVKKADYKVIYSSNTNAGTGMVTVEGVGNCSGQIQKTFTIQKAAPVITVTMGTNIRRYTNDGQFSLGAKLSNGGILHYKSSNEAVLTVAADGKVQPMAAGTAIITISYPGDSNYKMVTQTVNVKLENRSSNDDDDSGSGGSGSGSSGAGGGSSVTGGPSTSGFPAGHSAVPNGYTGKVKTIGGITVPEYVVSGTWNRDDSGNWRFTDSHGTAYSNRWSAIFNPYAKYSQGQSAFDWFSFDQNGNMRC